MRRKPFGGRCLRTNVAALSSPIRVDLPHAYPLQVRFFFGRQWGLWGRAFPAEACVNPWAWRAAATGLARKDCQRAEQEPLWWAVRALRTYREPLPMPSASPWFDLVSGRRSQTGRRVSHRLSTSDHGLLGRINLQFALFNLQFAIPPQNQAGRLAPGLTGSGTAAAGLTVQVGLSSPDFWPNRGKVGNSRQPSRVPEPPNRLPPAELCSLR